MGIDPLIVTPSMRKAHEARQARQHRFEAAVRRHQASVQTEPPPAPAPPKQPEPPRQPDPPPMTPGPISRKSRDWLMLSGNREVPDYRRGTFFAPDAAKAYQRVVDRVPLPLRSPVTGTLRTRIMVDDVTRCICAWYNVSRGELVSRSKRLRVCVPRMVAMFIASEIVDLSVAEIGRKFERHDHTTALHAVKKVRRILDDQSDLDIAAAVAWISAWLIDGNAEAVHSSLRPPPTS